jgi:hypothetical protein
MDSSHYKKSTPASGLERALSSHCSTNFKVKSIWLGIKLQWPTLSVHKEKKEMKIYIPRQGIYQIYNLKWAYKSHRSTPFVDGADELCPLLVRSYMEKSRPLGCGQISATLLQFRTLTSRVHVFLHFKRTAVKFVKCIHLLYDYNARLQAWLLMAMSI